MATIRKPKERTEQPLHALQISDALLKIKTVQALVGLSKTSIYTRMSANPPTFPQAIRQGTRCTRWRAGDVQAWLQAQAQKGGAQ